MFSFQLPKPTEEEKALNRRNTKRTISSFLFTVAILRVAPFFLDMGRKLLQ
ncbi:hypothetical protein BDF22DRAFT_740612 [Syncephalis plumigaleata]|nr:hypothetical protein BDF22DRAFT_740612 [Syncephalis plumigaleata]